MEVSQAAASARTSNNDDREAPTLTFVVTENDHADGRNPCS